MYCQQKINKILINHDSIRFFIGLLEFCQDLEILLLSRKFYRILKLKFSHLKGVAIEAFTQLAERVHHQFSFFQFAIFILLLWNLSRHPQAFLLSSPTLIWNQLLSCRDFLSLELSSSTCLLHYSNDLSYFQLYHPHFYWYYWQH